MQIEPNATFIVHKGHLKGVGSTSGWGAIAALLINGAIFKLNLSWSADLPQRPIPVCLCAPLQIWSVG